MSQDTRPQVIECPHCKAPKGEPCKTFNRELQYPHDGRYRAAGISYGDAPEVPSV